MNNQPINPSQDLSAINDRITATVRSHRIKIRVLSTVAFMFGFLAIATSLGLAWSYVVFVLPRQSQMVEDGLVAMQQAKTHPATEPVPTSDDTMQIHRFLSMQADMVRSVSVGTSMLALAVGVLGLGTLVLLTVVILSRRSTLDHVNTSLVEISQQLRDLRNASRGAPPV